MQKELRIHKVEKKSGVILQYQYLINITNDQTYYSPLFNTVEELDAWFKKSFSDEPVEDSFHTKVDRWGE